MRRKLAFGLVLLAALSLAVTTSAGKPAKPPLGTPVTVTFTNGTGFAIQSDGGAYINGVDGVTALIVPLGNLQLKSGDARKFWLDFEGACIDGPCDPPPTDYRQGYMTTSCDVAFLDMNPIGSFQQCNLNVHFTYDEKGWFIRFGEYAGTDLATVTRISDASWTIDVPAEGIALLESYPLKGRVTWTSHGYYHMPVNLTVTLQ